ncbi:thiamine ABC transporter ATP-binding protein [Loktanella sp. S4079]|uniref:thiamine ABC transporter ATP-binding protein n=1 Tax=Loktanella sp. S4079 TaxID=579483 RepID=UPI0005F9E291|nr:ATP-binding cassette domain-containing protein [Loktanella sp. S4079]KJZ19448.1 thiamine ABC transporter ATP-binding protein [Loktanella sp. S4079]
MLMCEQLVLAQESFSLTADFAFRERAITGVIGPSGVGKSTFLSAIAGFFAPASGRILWQGNDMVSLPPAKRPVSILFQDNNLFPHLTVTQNVGLGLSPTLRLSDGDRSRVDTVLKQVGLGRLGDRKPAALSGGQQSRAALARVLLADRPVVLLDEPFSALGPGLKDEMLDLVGAMLAENGRTVIMVTHDPNDAKRIADEVVLVAEGVAHSPVPTHEIFENPPQALRAYLG